MSKPTAAPKAGRIPSPYEVHITVPSGFDVREAGTNFSRCGIRNFDAQQRMVQEYDLLTARFDTGDQIPWNLAKLGLRFKVERKVAMLSDQGLIYDDTFFDQPESHVAAEIHVVSETKSSNTLSSAVNQTKHQTAFYWNETNLTLAKAEELVGAHLDSAKRLYLEIVLFDNNPSLDRDWESACA